mgnify:CR=1 FL=1
MLLEQLGADAGILSQFASFAADGCVLGRVAVSIRDEYRVLTEAGEWRAEPTGALLYGAASQADLPVVGDWVALRAIGGGEAVVQAVLPRRTKFSRRAAGTREDEQALAANVDTALLVTGLDGDFNPRRIERYLTLAIEAGVEPVVVLSKADLCADLAGPCGRRRGSLAGGGWRGLDARSFSGGRRVAAISSLSDEGVAALDGVIAPRRTFVLLGSSGAGKSTLLNRLAGEERLRTGTVRESDSRGRHTTTHRELIVLASGAILIDTPGMRELQLWAGREALDETFDEIAELATRCRFGDCSHRVEGGCAVRQALEAGELDPARWENYRKLQGEIRRHELLADHTAAAAEKAKWKAIHKAVRVQYKLRGK